jgi:hypothetical protein
MVRSEGDTSLKNPVTPPGIDPWTFRLVAQRLNHYATPEPQLYIKAFFKLRPEDGLMKAEACRCYVHLNILCNKVVLDYKFIYSY